MDEHKVDRTNIITRTNLGVVQATAEQMDQKRRNTAILDYLCKLDEAREWVSSFLSASQSAVDLSTFMRELPKGEWLAEISVALAPELRKNRIYRGENREYLHTDNINMFLSMLRRIKLSRHFFFEVIDLYESKNIPKVIYCIHGLAHFVSRRGLGRGIAKSSGVFSEADRALVGSDINEIERHRYEDIQSRMDSEESDGLLNRHATGQQSADAAERELIRAFARTYVWSAAFSDVFTGRSSYLAGIPAIRKFISPEMYLTEDEEQVRLLYSQILEKFKTNYAMQSEKDSIVRSIRLLLENQSRLRQIPFNEYPPANDYRLFKRVLYNLLHDFELLHRMVQEGFELPMDVFYPDNRLGDYYFSKFMEYLIQNGHSESARKVAGLHFMASKAFKTLTALFDNMAADVYGNTASKQTGSGLSVDAASPHKYSVFDLNPVNVSEYLYNELPRVNEYEIYNRKALLDEAIRDKNVRIEIARRASIIIEYLTVRLEYISKIDMPYYVRMFVSSAGFFEDFLEPAILLSKNFIISELIKYVFYSKDLFERQTQSYETESLTYYKCKIDRTTNFDFTDYSPLRDWLESEENKNFSLGFRQRNFPVETVNESFLDCTADKEIMKVEICLEEVNNLIIVFKESAKLMDQSLRSLVSRLTLLRQKPVEAGTRVEIETGRALAGSSHAADIVVDGRCVENNSGNGHTMHILHTAHSVAPNIQSAAHPHTAAPSVLVYAKEKFSLALDTQLIDLDNEDVVAIESILNNVKSRLALLISISTDNSLSAILNSTSEEEELLFGQMTNGKDLASYKKNVQEDIEFLSQKGILSKADGSILDLLARDILKRKYMLGVSEYRLNQETVDALFKKSLLLREQLEYLYKYTAALFSRMCCNKSGVLFNRQAKPPSRYGTYRYSLSVLQPCIYENITSSNLQFLISMEEPLVFSLEIFLDGAGWLTLENVRVDELLRLAEDGIACFDVSGVMTCNVQSLLSLVNEQYIRY